jgi:putative ABC transport system substrate-binding protein
MTVGRRQRAVTSKNTTAKPVSRIVVLICLLLAVFLPAGSVAQLPGKIPRIGFLTPFSVSDTRSTLGFGALRQGLQDLGYVEGKNIHIEYRYAAGNFARLPELTDELVRLNVDIFVVPNDTTAQVVHKATATTPIVMASSGNPIGSGLIASLARPGGNVTGLTSYTAELLGKRMDLLREVLPKVSRFAFLTTAQSATRPGGSATAFKEAQAAAKALGIQLQLVEIKGQNPDLEAAFRLIVKERVGALVISPVPPVAVHRLRILQLVEQNRLPAMYPQQEWTTAGGLMSYGANQVDQYRRAAVYVDKILKGAQPADLPVEQPRKFEFVINLKTAKVLNLTIPQSVLFRADKVIK